MMVSFFPPVPLDLHSKLSVTIFFYDRIFILRDVSVLGGGDFHLFIHLDIVQCSTFQCDFLLLLSSLTLTAICILFC